MCKKGTLGRLAVVLTCGLAALGQTPLTQWHRVGSSVRELGLAGLAGGAVDRVWYSDEGTTLFARTPSGVFATSDFETWRKSDSTPPIVREAEVRSIPEPGAATRWAGTRRAYSFGRFVYSSTSRGSGWDNLSAVKTPVGLQSIVGTELRDLAVSPRNEEELVVAGDAGVFRSLDGGLSWSALNSDLPSLNLRRILAVPSGVRGVQLELASTSSPVVEWMPGERTAWRPLDAAAFGEIAYRRATGASALAIAGTTVYQGSQDGMVQTIVSAGQTAIRKIGDGVVTGIWADGRDPRLALAVVDSGSRRVLHTVDGGLFWDDITANLPAGRVLGVTASRSSRAAYVATDNGVFYAETDVANLGAVPAWTRVTGLPGAAVVDVKLDGEEGQLWAAVQGYGVFRTLAPHRTTDPRVVSAADLVSRAAAPGALLSVQGAKVRSVRSGEMSVPVLNATDVESQIQVPFEARGGSLGLSIEPENGARITTTLAMSPAAPAILVAPEGSPFLLDGDRGVTFDLMNPARSRSRVQILATGLGRVTPDWPTAMAAPFDNPPRVAADVRAYLDGQPVNVTSAGLAGGYTGLYLVEVEFPQVVNSGPSELYLEVGERASNRVRVFVEP